MKLALVIERFEPWLGGAETSTVQFAQKLAAGGIDLTVITNQANMQPEQPMRIIRTQITRPRHLGQLRAFVRAVDRIVRYEQFDLVHALTPCKTADIYQPRGGIIPEIIARNVAIRSSPVQRSIKLALMKLSPKLAYLGHLERYLAAKQTCTFVGVSDYVCRQVRLYYHVPHERTVQVFNGVDLASLSNWSKDAVERIKQIYRLNGQHTLGLFVAHNFKLKGLDSILDALRILSQRGRCGQLKIMVVGGGNPKRYIRRARDWKIDQQLVFVGPARQVAEFYQLAQFCLLPTFYDPCSRVVLEALACQLPCITTTHNGAAEIMEAAREGFIITTKPISSSDAGVELAERLEQMCDPALREKMSQAARGLREQVSLARHVKQMLALYDKLLSKKAV